MVSKKRNILSFFNLISFSAFKIATNLQKQLESEKLIRKKLEQFIKKYNKISDLSSIINLENEATL